MNAADQRRLTPWLVAACVVLAAVWMSLAVGLGRGVHWKPPGVSHPLPAASHAAAVPAPPLADYTQIWQRPLFTITRQPAPEAASGGQNAGLGNLELTGVILASSLHMALLRDRKDGHGMRVREGTHLGGSNWVLETLKPRSAVFTDHGRRTHLTLETTEHDAPTQTDTPGGTLRAKTTAVASPSTAHHPSAQQHARIESLKKRIEQRRRQQAAHAGDH